VPRPSADRLLREALDVPFRGWDFSALGERIVVEPPPWPFEQMVDDAAAWAASMLDMGTGGGEWLCQRQRGVSVVHDEGAADNAEQAIGTSRGRLPFRNATFDLVVNRHEAFVASEVYRVLKPGAVFLTQQASSGMQRLCELLDVEVPPDREFHLSLAVEQLEQAGLRVDQSGTGVATTVFADIGALAWYLTNVPWAIPDFSIDRYRDALLALYGDPIAVASERFWVHAVAEHHLRGPGR
jgi:SAM-dependent methyltransferase